MVRTLASNIGSSQAARSTRGTAPGEGGASLSVVARREEGVEERREGGPGTDGQTALVMQLGQRKSGQRISCSLALFSECSRETAWRNFLFPGQPIIIGFGINMPERGRQEENMCRYLLRHRNGAQIHQK